MSYHAQKNKATLPEFLGQCLEIPTPMCSFPHLVYDPGTDEHKALVLKTKIAPHQREQIERFVDTINRIEGFRVIYISNAIRSRKRERGWLVVLKHGADPGEVMRTVERI